MVFLQGVGVSTSLAVRIYKKYGDASISVVRERAVPAGRRRVGHRLQDRRHDRPGGRHPARQPAAGQGRPPVHPVAGRRPRATATCPSRTWSPTPRRSSASDAELVRACLAELAAERGRGPRTGARPRRRTAGRSRRCTWCRSTAPRPSLAAALLRLLRPRRRTGCPPSPTVDWDKALAWLRARTGAELAPEQEQAVRLALTEQVAVLTGGPGCGKSFTVRSIVDAGRGEAGQGRAGRADRPGREAAGRADRAPRPPPCTGCWSCARAGTPPSTGTTRWTPTWSWSTRPRMLDLLLANKLVKAVPPGAHLLLVGDVDQLPSVGAGRGAARPARRRQPSPGSG